MKLRYIIGAFLGMFLLAGCQQEELVGTFDDLTVEKSFVSISMDGGSATLKITSPDAWHFAKIIDSKQKDAAGKTIMVELPTWLTANTLSGNAGTTDVTFTATATTGGRETELEIVCGGKSQFLRVRQGTLEATSATVKEIYDGPDGKTYRVKGTCTGIYNTQYGNWYLDDGSNGDKVLTIYGTLDKDGKTKNFESLGIEVGDVVTVEGPKTTYGSTVELVDVTVLKIEKALVKIVEAPEKAASKDGGDVTVTVAYKGSGVYPTVSNDAKDWLVYKSTEFKVGVPTIFEKSPADTAIVTFTLAANQAGARSGVVNFTSSTSAKNTTTVPVTISQEGSIVSVSVAQFLAAEVGDSQYRLTGVISKVLNTSYGNVNIKDYSGEVYVYGIGAKGDFEKLGLKEGDIVTLVGKRGDHNGPQMTGGQYESHIPVTKKTVAELREMSDDKTTYYMVTGKVAHIEETNADWDITKSGKFHIKDETGSIYVYKVATGWAGPADQFGTLEVKEGDTITIIGYRTSYTKNDYKLLQIAGGVYISHETPSASDEVFAKVTAAPTNWAGDYLLVWNGEAHATASSKDLAKTVDVTITDGAIKATAAVKAAAVKVAAIEGGYSITLPGGKFLTFTTNGNQCTFADAAAPMNFEFTESGVKISGVDAGSNSRYLLENATGENICYRGYKADKLGAEGYSLPTLYKFTAVN